MIKIVHYKPLPELCKYVRKISVFESKNGIQLKQKLTPSAFTYLSYNHLDIPKSIFGKRIVHPKERLQIAGPKTNTDIYVEYNGKLKQILVEFTASAFYYLFHKSPLNNANSLTSLHEFLPYKEVTLLEKAISSTDDVERQIKLIEEILLEKRYKALPFCNYLEQAIGIIEENHGSVTIKKVAEQVKISERQLDRKFSAIVGVKPKRYSQITQLHYVINLINTKNYKSFQDIAFSAEYYDLPHFSHKFKEMTGLSPAEFVNSENHLALKFFKDLIEQNK